jgi:ribosomal 50S subunit-recycling heat shock protein
MMSKIIDDMLEEVKLETARTIAKRMIDKGTVSYEDIAQVTTLSLSEVQRLAESETE